MEEIYILFSWNTLSLFPSLFLSFFLFLFLSFSLSFSLPLSLFLSLSLPLSHFLSLLLSLSLSLPLSVSLSPPLPLPLSLFTYRNLFQIPFFKEIKMLLLFPRRKKFPYDKKCISNLPSPSPKPSPLPSLPGCSTSMNNNSQVRYSNLISLYMHSTSLVSKNKIVIILFNPF